MLRHRGKAPPNYRMYTTAAGIAIGAATGDAGSFGSRRKEVNMARSPGTRSDGRAFDEVTIEAVWQKGTPEPQYPSFRKDKCGASMQRTKYGKTEQWGWEVDHSKPVSKGGTDDISNLQPLQWENNRHKGDDYPNWTCKVKN